MIDVVVAVEVVSEGVGELVVTVTVDSDGIELKELTMTGFTAWF